MEKSNLIQFLSNAAIMAASIFIPIMAHEYGATAFQIGLSVGIFFLTYFIANYSFGVLADRICLRRLVQTGLAVATVVFLAQMIITDLSSLFLFRALAGLAAGIFPAALAVYAFEERAGLMGKFNAYSSLGWAVGAVLAGLIGRYQQVFMMSAVFFAAAWLVSLNLKDVCPQQPSPLFPWRLVRKNLRIYVPYFFRAVGAQSIWAIFPLYLMSIGADKFLIGVAFFVNLSAQFIMMQHIEKQKNLVLFNLGLLTSVITFIIYAVANNYWVILPVQLLLSYSFSALQVGSYQELLRVNREKGVTIGILNSIANLNAFVGPFLAGVLLAYWGFPGVMWFAAGITFVGLLSFTKVVK